MSQSNKFRTDLKIITIGNSGTGKTSLVDKWTKNIFSDTYKETIVSLFGFKIFENEGRTFRIQLWDLAGKDKNALVTKIFAKDADGILVLSDASNISTRENTIYWKTVIEESTTYLNGGKFPFLLVESKCDLIDETPEYEEGLKKFAETNEFIGAFSVSSKTGKNVEESIEFLIKHIIKRLENNMKTKGTNGYRPIEVENNEEEKYNKKYNQEEKKGKEKNNEDKNDNYEVGGRDINFYNEDENLEIYIRKNGSKYSCTTDFYKLKEKYEILGGMKDTDKLIEILEELKDKGKVIINYYLENVVIQIGIIFTTLYGDQEEITFELINEDIESVDLTKYLIKEIKRLKEEESNDEENESEEDEKKSEEKENDEK